MKQYTVFLLALIVTFSINKAYLDWRLTNRAEHNVVKVPGTERLYLKANSDYKYDTMFIEMECNKALKQKMLITMQNFSKGRDHGIRKPSGASQRELTKRISVDEIMQASRTPYCKNRKALTQSTYDPFEKYQVEEESNLDVLSPFNCTANKGYLNGIHEMYIPARRWSYSKKKFNAGGLTADMGWILMVVRYSLIKGNAVQFPSYWDHGCPGNMSIGGWTCFFKQITPESCIQHVHRRVPMILSSMKTRQLVKLKDRYLESSDKRKDLYRNRNREIAQLVGSWLRYDNDVQTMRYVFKWAFQLQAHARRDVELYKQNTLGRLSKPYISIHIRWGDKVGKNNNNGEPIEGTMVPLETYRNMIYCYYTYNAKRRLAIPRTIFIATDDHNAVLEFIKLMGPEFNIVTTAQPYDRGFSIHKYNSASFHTKYSQTIALWADLEYLSEGELFLANFQSNIARMVHLMRIGRPVNSSIAVPLAESASSRSCCALDRGSSLMANCFWTCT